MKGIKDQEFIDLRNKFLIGLFFACIFGAGIIMFFFFCFCIGGGISSKIKNKESFVIYLDSDNCGENCDKVKKILDDNNISYEKLSYSTQQAQNFIEKYNIVDDGHIVPAVFYVRKGKVYSSMYNIRNTEELKLFIKNYKLSSK